MESLNHKEFSLNLIKSIINDLVTTECLVSNIEYSGNLLIITVTACGAYTKIESGMYKRILQKVRAYTPYVEYMEVPWKAGNIKGNTSVEFIFTLTATSLKEFFEEEE